MKLLGNLSAQQGLELIRKSLDDLDDCLNQLRSCPEDAREFSAGLLNGAWGGKFAAAIAEMRGSIEALERAAESEQGEEKFTAH